VAGNALSSRGNKLCLENRLKNKMGMFDSFYLRAKCPYCGKEDIIEFQTKQFECNLDVWNEGDEFEQNDLEITEGLIKGVYGGCGSEQCHSWDKAAHGYKSGFGRGFYCDVLIQDNKVIKAVNIREEDVCKIHSGCGKKVKYNYGQGEWFWTFCGQKLKLPNEIVLCDKCKK
jgi:hypothetical protein